MQTFQYKLAFQVRDYECDFQGIVGNATYLNYLLHARDEFVKRFGLDAVKMAQEGINLVVTRVEIDYKQPLKSGDSFWVGVNLQRASKIRLLFLQEIYHSVSNILILKANVTIVAVNSRGKPFFPEEFHRLPFIES